MASKQYRPEQLVNRYSTINIVTAGYDTASSPIIEIAVTKVVDGRQVERFRSFVDAGVKSLPESVEKNTGIGIVWLKGSPTIEQVMSRVIEIVDEDVIIASNSARFVRPFVEKAALESCGVIMGNEWLDILKIGKQAGVEYRRESLTDLCEKLGIEKERNHRALVDADAIHKAYQILRCRILGIANIDQHAFDEAPLEEMGADTVGMVDARSRRNIHLVVAVVFGLMTVSALYGSLVNGMPLGSALIGAVITLIAVRNMVKQSKRLASISHKDEEDSPFK